MTALFDAAPAFAHALLHAAWQGAACALVVAIALTFLRSAATRHALALAGMFAIVVAFAVTFVHYQRPLAPLTSSVLPPPVRIAPLMLHGSDWLALVLPLVWLLGAGLMLVRQLRGWRAVIGLHSSEAPRTARDRVDLLRQRLGISRAIAVRTAPTVSPFTARMRHPVIWLPATWDELSSDQRDALLAHELAHVRRLDWMWNGLQCLAEALLWFHPAVHWLSRRAREDREHACDDLAVATCGDPIALAEALAALARQHAPRLALGARGGSLVQRVARLLADAPVRTSRRALAGLVLMACGGTVLAAELELPRDALVDLRIDATAAGPLRPGTFREITAESFHGHRYYRGSMDDHGRVSEVFVENGRVMPIDGDVRAWLDELAAAKYQAAE